MKNRILLLLLPLLFISSAYALDNPATWIELGFSKKIIKNLKVEFNPELRLRGDYQVDTYILEAGVSYKLHKYLTLASYYRYENENNFREKRQIYEWESSNRIAFDAKSGFDLNRFDFQFRLRYTQGLYDNNDASEFRYRAKIAYNIKGAKLQPFASVELFHDQSVPNRDNISGGLKSIDKIRYTGGFSYAINKKNEVTLFYRLQDDRSKDETVNIMGIGYSLDF